MGLRLEPTDEYMHELGPESNFNESAYYSFYDGWHDLGGWVRLGNRANEGHSEMTTCLYLPGGAVGFWFDRAAISDNNAFEAGGLRFDVVEPFEELHVSYGGNVLILDDPHLMADPRVAFASSPKEHCSLALTYRPLSPPSGGEPEEPAEGIGGMELARGHYNQHMNVRGRITVGNRSWEVGSTGWRDHSWGPRNWQGPWWYRSLIGTASDAGFTIAVTGTRDGTVRGSGTVYKEGVYHAVTAVDLSTEWTTEHRYHDRLRCNVATEEERIEIVGRVKSLVPLRIRRGEETTRMVEALTEWEWDGRTAFGQTEYFDQIVDGLPVGD